MRSLSASPLLVLVLVLLAALLTLAAASDLVNGPADILEVRKHRHKHHHHHHNHHATTKRHHRKPTEPTGRKNHHKKPNAGETVTATKTSTRKHHHQPTATPTATRKHTKTVSSATSKSTTAAAPKPTTPSGPQGTFKYGLMYSDKIRGVNLGNWLVVEAWMDKRLDQALNAVAINAPASVVAKTKGHPIIDEYTIGLYADHTKAAALLKDHFDSWMTEKDWRRIAKAGLNSVRIPFPHYGFADCIEKGAPYLTLNRLEKLKEGVLMAKKYGLKVWLSLHSLPGSQNGYDSSGRIGPPQWATSDEYTALSNKAFKHLVEIFSQEPYASAILAIEPVNEPTAAQDADILATLKTYYPLAYDAVHAAKQKQQQQQQQQKALALAAAPASSKQVGTVQPMFAFHDGWKGMRYWASPPFWNETARAQSFFSVHPYYIFGDAMHNATDSQRVAKACLYGEKIANYSSVYTIVASEFGINAPRGDNGFGRDMHQADHLQFDNPELDYPFSDEYMRFLALNFRAQQQSYEKGAGWMLWSWKLYQHRDWSYKSGVRYGWLPKNAAELDRQPFGNLCS